MAARAWPCSYAVRYPRTSPITLPTVAHYVGRLFVGSRPCTATLPTKPLWA